MNRLIGMVAAGIVATVFWLAYGGQITIPGFFGTHAGPIAGAALALAAGLFAVMANAGRGGITVCLAIVAVATIIATGAGLAYWEVLSAPKDWPKTVSWTEFAGAAIVVSGLIIVIMLFVTQPRLRPAA